MIRIGAEIVAGLCVLAGCYMLFGLAVTLIVGGCLFLLGSMLVG